MTASPNLLRASSYAKTHRLCPRKVYRWIHNGKLRSQLIDGVYFIEEESPSEGQA